LDDFYLVLFGAEQPLSALSSKEFLHKLTLLRS